MDTRESESLGRRIDGSEKVLRGITSRSCFFAGTDNHPVYVDRIAPTSQDADRIPVLMLHGGFHTGSAYISTPDGRDGWAHHFARRGHIVYVADWPGHGRSPCRAPLETLSTLEVATSLGALVQEIGPVILVAHSAAGPLAWWIAENHSESVVAIVGIAPGPPANIQPALPDDPAAVNALRFDSSAGCPVYSELSSPVSVDAAFIGAYWANARRFPQAALASYAKSVVPESARLLNERFNIGDAGLKLQDPATVSRRPILVVTGDDDPRHSREADGAVAHLFGADFFWLAERGITGNGHMLMIENNSDEIADLIASWLQGRGL